MQVKHTFVILAYHQSSYLEDCIKSLLNQKLKSKVIISTSTPNNLISDLAKKYSIQIITNSSHKNISSDWNFALNLAQTKYVTLAHQDDIYLDNYTSSLVNLAEKNDDNLITFSDYFENKDGENISYNIRLITKKILLTPLRIKHKISSMSIKKLILAFGSPICCPSVMYNKKNLQNFEFSTKYKVDLDWDAWLSIAKKKGSIAMCSKKLLIHRIHSSSETSKAILNKTREKEDFDLFSKIWKNNLLVKIIMSLYSKSYK